MIFNQQMPAKWTQIITGTLANPFVGMDNATYGKFQTEYYYGITTARLDVDTSLMGYGVVPLSLDISVIEPKFDYLYMESHSTDVNTVVSASVVYPGSFLIDPFLTQADFLINGTITDVRDYAEHLPTTLTIYWGGGSGNNRTQVVEGTLEQPFGDIDFMDLLNGIQSGDASAVIYVNGTSVVGEDFTAPLASSLSVSDSLYFATMYGSGTQFLKGGLVLWYQGNLSTAAVYASDGTGTSLMSVASQISTRLTVYWHRMDN